MERERERERERYLCVCVCVWVCVCVCVCVVFKGVQVSIHVIIWVRGLHVHFFRIPKFQYFLLIQNGRRGRRVDLERYYAPSILHSILSSRIQKGIECSTSGLVLECLGRQTVTSSSLFENDFWRIFYSLVDKIHSQFN